jgi:hypothetical protein
MEGGRGWVSMKTIRTVSRGIARYMIYLVFAQRSQDNEISVYLSLCNERGGNRHLSFLNAKFGFPDLHSIRSKGLLGFVLRRPRHTM